MPSEKEFNEFIITMQKQKRKFLELRYLESSSFSAVHELSKLIKLLEQGYISQEEYTKLKKELLSTDIDDESKILRIRLK